MGHWSEVRVTSQRSLIRVKGRWSVVKGQWSRVTDQTIFRGQGPWSRVSGQGS